METSTQKVWKELKNQETTHVPRQKERKTNPEKGKQEETTTHITTQMMAVGDGQSRQTEKAPEGYQGRNEMRKGQNFKPILPNIGPITLGFKWVLFSIF